MCTEVFGLPCFPCSYTFSQMTYVTKPAAATAVIHASSIFFAPSLELHTTITFFTDSSQSWLSQLLQQMLLSSLPAYSTSTKGGLVFDSFADRALQWDLISQLIAMLACQRWSLKGWWLKYKRETQSSRNKTGTVTENYCNTPTHTGVS